MLNPMEGDESPGFSFTFPETSVAQPVVGEVVEEPPQEEPSSRMVGIEAQQVEVEERMEDEEDTHLADVGPVELNDVKEDEDIEEEIVAEPVVEDAGGVGFSSPSPVVSLPLAGPREVIHGLRESVIGGCRPQRIGLGLGSSGSYAVGVGCSPLSSR